MKTFCIQKGYTGRENLAVRLSAEKLGAKCVYREYPEEGEIPIGTVEFGVKAFGEHRVDFYPAFLSGTLHRGIMRTGGIGSSELCHPAFVKDATAWKSDWQSALHPCGFSLPRGDWWISEPVTFIDEWRYYVANGKIITTGWYQGVPDGQGEDAVAPEIDVEWPAGFSGACDFGTLSDGRVALVEAHAPLACGWYGEDHMDYARWQIEAWEHKDWWLTQNTGCLNTSRLNTGRPNTGLR